MCIFIKFLVSVRCRQNTDKFSSHYAIKEVATPQSVLFIMPPLNVMVIQTTQDVWWLTSYSLIFTMDYWLRKYWVQLEWWRIRKLPQHALTRCHICRRLQMDTVIILHKWPVFVTVALSYIALRWGEYMLWCHWWPRKRITGEILLQVRNFKEQTGKLYDVMTKWRHSFAGLHRY